LAEPEIKTSFQQEVFNALYRFGNDVYVGGRHFLTGEGRIMDSHATQNTLESRGKTKADGVGYSGGQCIIDDHGFNLYFAIWTILSLV